jgi:hypothetical protein
MLGMSEETSEIFNKIFICTVGPIIIFLTLIITSIIFIFYKKPCNKCIVRACCSYKCYAFKRWDELHDICMDAKNMPWIVVGGACYLLSIGVLIYTYFAD